MCSTPRSSSSSSRVRSTSTRPAFSDNKRYWSQLIAQRDEQLEERARIQALSSPEVEVQLEDEVELAPPTPLNEKKPARETGWLNGLARLIKSLKPLHVLTNNS